ncbi:DUF6090 family protein [Geojedonia litorea]|uniref:DUF6090 family protein n=1 Tax=Geojedonia litorea TaxID=1268269 RepID=A0ABV9N425_9FLAO
MIKFFRKIRYELMERNKTGKYLKYAIGEIILVVIGILIALSLNNLNELRKQEQTKQSYFNQLLIDIDKDTTVIANYIFRIKKSISTYESYLNMFKTPDLSSEEIIVKLKEVEVSFPVLRFNTNTSEVLISTGDIKLMPAEIRNVLMDLKRTKILISDLQIQNDAEYLRMLMNARQLGFGTYNSRLDNQPKHAEFLKLSENNREAIIILEAAFRLKNFSETSRVDLLKRILTYLETLKIKITKAQQRV